MILYFVIIFNLIGRICSTCKGGHVVSEENKTITFDVIIVGAGISGLEVYRKLSAENELIVGLLEARSRPGGRILTVLDPLGGTNNVSIDVGATWIHGSVLIDSKKYDKMNQDANQQQCTPPSDDELKDQMNAHQKNHPYFQNPLITMASIFNISLQGWPFQSFSDSSAYRLKASWWDTSGFVAYDVSSSSSSSLHSVPISSNTVQSAWLRYCLLMNGLMEQYQRHVSSTSTIFSNNDDDRLFFSSYVKEHINMIFTSYSNSSSSSSTLSIIEKSLIRLFIDAFEDDVGATLKDIHPYDWDFASSLLGIDHVLDHGMSSFVQNMLNESMMNSQTSGVSTEETIGSMKSSNNGNEKSTIIYNAEVKRIQWNDSSCLFVTTKNGIRYRARDSIVITVPISILQRSISSSSNSSSSTSSSSDSTIFNSAAIQFIPPLPVKVSNAINNIGMGHSMKVFIRFKTTFWPKNATLLTAVGSVDETLLFSMFWSLSSVRNNSSPVLVTAATGNVAEKMELWSNSKLQHHVLRSLAAMFGNDVVSTNFLGIRRTNWSTDKYSLGAYSYPKYHPPLHGVEKDDISSGHNGKSIVGSSVDSSVDSSGVSGIDAESRSILTDALGINDTLYFAGEATSEEYYGTVHGAFMSGIRVARNIIQHQLLDELHESKGKPPAVIITGDQVPIYNLNVYDLDERSYCQPISKSIIKLSSLHLINNITIYDTPKSSSCWDSFLHLFQYLVGCTISLNKINMKSIGLTSDDVVKLSKVFVPPLNIHENRDIFLTHDWCGIEKDQMNLHFYPRYDHLNHLQHHSSSPKQPLIIDLSGNDIIIATDLVKAWLKWRRPVGSSRQNLLPVLDLSDNEINTEGATQIARLLQYVDKQYNKRKLAFKKRKRKSRIERNKESKKNKQLEYDDHLLGCILLHDNQIEEEGLFELSNVNLSRWCITLHDNIWKDIPFSSPFPKDCTCRTNVKLTKRIGRKSLVGEKNKMESIPLNCVRTNSYAIVNDEFSGQDDWSNQLWNKIFERNPTCGKVEPDCVPEDTK